MAKLGASCLGALLLAFGCVWPASGQTAQQAWSVEWQTGQFLIHADFPVEQPKVLEAELQALQADVGEVLHIQPHPGPVHIVLFETAREYTRYMDAYFPQLPSRRAWFLQDRGPGMLFTHWHTEITTDLRHEVTHALLNQTGQPLPLWLDEGLAEYFEVERLRRFDGTKNLQAICQRAAEGYVPSLERLEQIDDLGEFGSEQYRDSWSWVHFMLHRSEQTHAVLTRFLQTARAGTEQLPLSRQLAQQAADLHVEYRKHFEACRPVERNF